MSAFIYGKDSTEGIVSVDVKDSAVYLFKEDGTFTLKPFRRWLLTAQPFDNSRQLVGNLHYKYIKEYATRTGFFESRKRCKFKNIDTYACFTDSEAHMLRSGTSLYKGMKYTDVSVLSFDIEATGLTHDRNSKVLIISNTYRSAKGEIIKRLFSVDNYGGNDKRMIEDWCDWVRKVDPSIMCGHNIFGYDLPYLQFCSGGNLKLGRCNNYMKVDNYTRRFRKDGSQTYDYQNVEIFGRQVIDTFFLAIKYDIGRKYRSYALKSIITEEGLEKKDRQHYDASKIKDMWGVPEERERIKQYALDDSDDSLKLLDLMMPQFFYYTQHLPMTLQWMNNTATGKQVNSFLLRSYLQAGHSIPAASQAGRYQGAISQGNPGIYYDVAKVDVASLYPSIILSDKIYDDVKDPLKNFLKMVEYFTAERLENKKLAKESGDRYYKSLEQSQKIFINSAYGMMGANGLHFNSPKNAQAVTRRGREILSEGMKWVSENGYKLVNVDTDSFSYTKNRVMSRKEYEQDLEDINSRFPPGIVWEDDGLYKCVIVLKAKNYVMFDGEKYIYKGSGLKDQKKEPALKEFLKKCIECIIQKQTSQLPIIYNNYAIEIINVTDIDRWATKMTISERVLNGEGTTQQKIRQAIEGVHVYEGDKIWVYPAIDGQTQDLKRGEPQFYKDGKPKLINNRVLKLVNNWDNDLDIDHLLKRLYDTVKILANVVDMELFLNYSLKRNKQLLLDMVQPEPEAASN